jgi:predicted ATPase
MGVLSESRPAVLRALSVFLGSFGFAAASAVVVSAAMAALDIVEGFVKTSHSGGRRHHVQYRLLETTRAYARKRLVEAGEPEEAETQRSEQRSARPAYTLTASGSPVVARSQKPRCHSST